MVFLFKIAFFVVCLPTSSPTAVGDTMEFSSLCSSVNQKIRYNLSTEFMVKQALLFTSEQLFIDIHIAYIDLCWI